MTDISANPVAINLDKPRYDQNTFSGRAKHFFITTNPLNVFTSSKELEKAKSIVESYRWVFVLLNKTDINNTINLLIQVTAIHV